MARTAKSNSSADVESADNISIETEFTASAETKNQIPDLNSILGALEEYKKIIEEQKKIIEEMKNQPKEKTVAKDTTVQPQITYDPNRIIAVVNMYDGESLTLKTGHQGEVSTLYGFGDKQYFRYEVAANMARMNRNFATKGYFIFEDKDIIRDFGLEKDYEKFIDKSIIDKLDTLDAQSLQALYNRSNDAYRAMIIDKFVSGYVAGINGFRQMDKIEALANVSGKDIQYTIEEVQKAKRMNK